MADWVSFERGRAGSLSLYLFLLIQISHAVMANFSKLFPSSFMMLTRSYSDSMQFEFNTIRATTNNFSDANKLGKDGFGAVYRVRSHFDIIK